MDTQKTQVTKYCLYADTDGSRKITLRVGEWLPGSPARVILANSFFTDSQISIVKDRRRVDVFYKQGTSVFSLRPEKAGFDWQIGMTYNKRQDHVVHLWRTNVCQFVGFDHL